MVSIVKMFSCKNYVQFNPWDLHVQGSLRFAHTIQFCWIKLTSDVWNIDYSLLLIKQYCICFSWFAAHIYFWSKWQNNFYHKWIGSNKIESCEQTFRFITNEDWAFIVYIVPPPQQVILLNSFATLWTILHELPMDPTENNHCFDLCISKYKMW